MTKVITNIDEIIALMRNDKTIALPTDTVYGLMAPLSEKGLNNIKLAKSRDENKPIPIMVNGLKMLERIADVKEYQLPVINKFMPGCITIIFNKKDCLNDNFTNGLATVGVRIPDDQLLLDVMEILDSPILVTSANLSGQPTCFNDAEVLDQLDGRIDGIILGHSSGNKPSTIVDMTSNELKIIRQGDISWEMLMEVQNEN
ncbi:MAG: L-threonylcarbamoyladenylate synthase [Erysipelotrichaceae bacterium]